TAAPPTRTTTCPRSERTSPGTCWTCSPRTSSERPPSGGGTRRSAKRGGESDGPEEHQAGGCPRLGGGLRGDRSSHPRLRGDEVGLLHLLLRWAEELPRHLGLRQIGRASCRERVEVV